MNRRPKLTPEAWIAVAALLWQMVSTMLPLVFNAG
jgi:hypothetical protein